MRRFREHYSSFIAPTSPGARPNPSRRLQLPPSRWVFAGCCQSLLVDGPSRRYLRNPCIGAWTRTPQRPFGAFLPFLPEGHRPRLRCDKLGTPKYNVAMQLQQRGSSRGCSHSFMFTLPYLLDPPVAPHRCESISQGGRAFYSTQCPSGYPT